MLIWIYYAAQIVLFGAEFTRVYAQARGRGIRPAKHAVRVDRKEIELPPLTDRGEVIELHRMIFAKTPSAVP